MKPARHAIQSIISLDQGQHIMRIGPSRELTESELDSVVPVEMPQLIRAVRDTPSVNLFMIDHNAVTANTFGMFCVELLKRTEPFSLTLHATPLSTDVLEKCLMALLSSLYLKGLSLVDVDIGPEFGQVLALSGSFSHLESLSIIRDPLFGDTGAAGVSTMLSQSRYLENVNLSGCGITDIGAAALQMGARKQHDLIGSSSRATIDLSHNDDISQRFFFPHGRIFLAH